MAENAQSISGDDDAAGITSLVTGRGQELEAAELS